MFKKSYAISKISFLENNKKTLVLNSNSARGDELLTGLKAHQGLLLRLSRFAETRQTKKVYVQLFFKNDFKRKQSGPLLKMLSCIRVINSRGIYNKPVVNYPSALSIYVSSCAFTKVRALNLENFQLLSVCYFFLSGRQSVN